MLVADLFGFWTASVLPLPVLIGAGVVLAIASNHNKHIRITSRPDKERIPKSPLAIEKSTEKSGPNSAQHSPGSAPNSPKREPQLPTLGRSPKLGPKRPISFTIKETDTEPR